MGIKKEKSEKELLEEISEKIDKLIAISVIQGIVDQNDKIYALKEFGFKEADVKLLVIIKGRIRDSEGWKRK